MRGSRQPSALSRQPGAASCAVCGGRINRGNRVGICNRNQECRRAYARIRKRMVAGLPLTDRHCGHCGHLLRTSSPTDFCSRTPACRRLQRLGRYHLRAMRLGPPRECKLCGGRIYRTNRTGYCDSSPACRRAARLVLARLDVGLPASRGLECEVCGRRIHRTNRTGVCTVGSCRAVYARRRYAADPELRACISGRNRAWARKHHQQHLAARRRWYRNYRDALAIAGVRKEGAL